MSKREAGDAKHNAAQQIIADIQHSPIIEEVLCAVREQLVAHLPVELARAVADSWPLQVCPGSNPGGAMIYHRLLLFCDFHSEAPCLQPKARTSRSIANPYTPKAV